MSFCGFFAFIMAIAFTITACPDPNNGGKTQIAKPALAQSSFTHNGSPHTVALTAENAAYSLGGDVTKTDFGNYTATVTLTNTAIYEWADGTTDPLQLAWSIGKQHIAQPTLAIDDFPYTGETRTVTLNPENEAYSLTSGFSGSAVGNYTAIVTLTDTVNFAWTGGSSEPLGLSWSIGIANPTVNWPSDLTAVYGQTLANVTLPNDNGSGTAGSFTWVQAATTLVGDAGDRTHELRFTPTDTESFRTATQNVTVNVARAEIGQPTLTSNSLTFNGNPQTVTLNPINAAAYSLTAGQTQTNAGSHIATVTLTANYAWIGGSTTLLQLDWTISPLAVTITPHNGQSKMVCVAADPVLTYDYSPALLGGNTFSNALSREAGNDVGTYEITLGNLSAGSNYTLSFTSGVFFTINDHDWQWLGIVGDDSARTVSIQETCTVCNATRGNPQPNITTTAQFATVMASLPTNNATEPYTIRLNVSDLGGSVTTADSIGGTLLNNSNKFVNLDMSGSTITSIVQSAFNGCTSLASITIPNSVTSIGIGAFIGCNSLASITIPDSVTSIGFQAFRDCTSLASVTLPNNSNFTTISAGAFRNTGLTSIIIPNTVTSIQGQQGIGGAFQDCTNLTEITIPDSVTNIGISAFQGCTSLIGSFNETLDFILLTIPDSVTSIGNDAFRNCTSLEGVLIGDGVTTIGDNAFRNCTKLTIVIIGSKVATIGENAFNGVSLSGGLVFMNDTTTFNNNSFPYGDSLNSVYTESGAGIYMLMGETWSFVD